MQTLEYEINGKRNVLEVPESFEEMSCDQFLEATKMVSGGIDNNTVSPILTGLPAHVIKALDPFEIYEINRMFDFINSDNMGTMQFVDWKIPRLTIKGKVYYGPASNFGNITWQEFIYADQCMMNGLYDAMIAALYRPERTGFNGETDRRIPFTIYGTTNRFNEMSHIPEYVRLAIILNYKAMRKAAMEEKYEQIFPYYDNTGTDDDTDEEPEEKDGDNEKSSFSWTHVHRRLLGDDIQYEDKYLNLNVHTVLFRLNAIIMENKKIKV